MQPHNISNKNVLNLSLDFKKLILTLIFLFYAIILLRTAWISDDAAITLRTVLNFVHGNGLVFNLGERVQAYTHPLWLLVLSASYIIFSNIFVSTFFISIFTALLSILLLIKYIALDYKNAAAITLLILFSQAFIDYSTSGLENPLSYMLFAIFTIVLLKSYQKQFSTNLSQLWFIFALIYLNRPDAILIPFPILLYVTYKNYLITNRFIYILKLLLIGLTPALLWTCFAIIYYGLPFPNTAYAKLGTGIPQSELLLQGIYYFFDSLKYDPFTLSVITIAIIISFLSRQVVTKLLVVGILLYLVYILKIGGDFMSGRFFAYPFFVATIILALTKFNTYKSFIAFYTLLIFWGSYSISINNNGVLRDIDVTTLATQNLFDLIKPSGIADERKFYYFQNRGLLHSARSTFNYEFEYDEPLSATYDDIQSICGGLGYKSLYSGNTIYWIDTCALADPLLSRIPMTYNSNWRIGHFKRTIPVGYKDSLLSNKNFIQDKCLRNLYDKIKIITRGKLFSMDRMYAILDMNVCENSCMQNLEKPNNLIVRIEELGAIKLAGHPWNEGTVPIQPNQALEVVLPVVTLVKSIDISFDNNDLYEVLFYDKDIQKGKLKLLGHMQPGLERQIIKLEKVLTIDKIIIKPKGGDQRYSVGHVIIG